MWDLISAHQERCACGDVARALEDLSAGREEAADALFEARHFDHYLRRTLLEEWGLTDAATEFILERALTEYMRARGLRATVTPEGVFHLERG